MMAETIQVEGWTSSEIVREIYRRHAPKLSGWEAYQRGGVVGRPEYRALVLPGERIITARDRPWILRLLRINGAIGRIGKIVASTDWPFPGILYDWQQLGDEL